jgi:hypothetical protein
MDTVRLSWMALFRVLDLWSLKVLSETSWQGQALESLKNPKDDLKKSLFWHI